MYYRTLAIYALKYICTLKYIYPTRFFTAPGLEWQPALKKIKVKLELLTNIDLLLMAGKGIRGAICYSSNKEWGIFIYMQKLITNIWKIMIKIKNCHIFNIEI